MSAAVPGVSEQPPNGVKLRRPASDQTRCSANGRREVAQRPDLFRLAIRFNHLIAGDLDPSHHAKFFDGPTVLFDRLVGSRRATARLSGMINTVTRWTPVPTSYFAEPRRRTALLDRASLVQLINLGAGAILTRFICGVLTQRERREVEGCLPPEIVQFARHRCRLTTAPIANRLTEVMEWDLKNDVCLSWNHAWQVARSRVAGLLLADLTNHLTDRVALKLPADWNVDPERLFSTQQQGACWQLIRRLIHTELDSQVQTCFR